MPSNSFLQFCHGTGFHVIFFIIIFDKIKRSLKGKLLDLQSLWSIGTLQLWCDHMQIFLTCCWPLTARGHLELLCYLPSYSEHWGQTHPTRWMLAELTHSSGCSSQTTGLLQQRIWDKPEDQGSIWQAKCGSKAGMNVFFLMIILQSILQRCMV